MRGLYAIMTRPRIPHDRFAGICAACGVEMLQLREKDLSDRALLETARNVAAVLRGSPTRFIVNDRPDLALLAGADGLHIGRDDLSPADVRRILPRGMLLGMSTHNPDQFREASENHPDYLGFGPLYPTPTKANPDPVTGLDPLRGVLATPDLPVVAIGGIFPENLREVLGTGVRCFAMVRYLNECGSEDELRYRIRILQDLFADYTSWENAHDTATSRP